MTEYPAPAALSRTLLSESPFTDVDRVSQRSNSSIYQAPSGAWVFGAGTNSWAWGLDDFWRSLADARIQRTTANILNVFLGAAP
jgi:hypothetical protein